MGLFDLFAGADINKGVEECHATEGAVLIDVRGADEYRQGHIPGPSTFPSIASTACLPSIHRRIHRCLYIV